MEEEIKIGGRIIGKKEWRINEKRKRNNNKMKNEEDNIERM